MPKAWTPGRIVRRIARKTLGRGGRPSRTAPNFVGVGTGRAGTTYLYQLLRKHDDFYMSPTKELNFFGMRFVRFAEDGVSIKEYKEHFAGAARQKYIGEITPTYQQFPEAFLQIKSVAPKARIIFTYRNPLNRMFSVFKHHKHAHGCATFQAYVDAALEAYVFGAQEHQWKLPVRGLIGSLYARGFYSAMRMFPREQILVLCYEDLERAPFVWHQQLEAFFGVPFPEDEHVGKVHNASKGADDLSLSAEADRRVRRLFAEDLAGLSKLTGMDMCAKLGFDPKPTERP